MEIYEALIPFYHNSSIVTDASVPLQNPLGPPSDPTVTPLAYTTHVSTARTVTAMRMAASFRAGTSTTGSLSPPTTITAQLVRIIPPSPTTFATGMSVTLANFSLTLAPFVVFSDIAVTPAVTIQPGELMGVFITITDFPGGNLELIDKVVVTLDVVEA